VIYFCIWM